MKATKEVTADNKSIKKFSAIYRVRRNGEQFEMLDPDTYENILRSASDKLIENKGHIDEILIVENLLVIEHSVELRDFVPFKEE